MSTKRKIAVIGAGPMGLVAAHELARDPNNQVVILERDSQVGGMTASFNFDGLQIERYYHFVCRPDLTLFKYLKEFGISERLKWVPTKMGFFYQGRLFDWGNPFALLGFPHLGLIDKMRYALHVMYAKSISNWRPYDAFSSTQWLQRWIGPRAFDVLWKPLFHFKFYEHQNGLSAAWLGTRIKRVALSRRSLLQEELGYIEGGSKTLLDQLVSRLDQAGVAIRLSQGVERIAIEDGMVTGVETAGLLEAFDTVVSTIPLPYLVKLAPGLPDRERQQVAEIKNIAVVCVLLKLRRAFSRNFWMNINDKRIEIPGLIEYSNLNPLEQHVIYAPFYMPKTHPKYQADSAAFIAETIAAMKLIDPTFSEADVLASTASRYEYAQTVAGPGFFDQLPPMQSAVKGLFLADTSHYYPEDRSISESARIGAELARLVQAAAAIDG